MNKILINLLFITATMAFFGCVREEDDLFDKSAVERLDEIGGIYSENITADGGTWVVELYPTNGFGFDRLETQDGGYEVSTPTSQYDGIGYLLGLQFNEDGTVRVGMNNALSNQRREGPNYTSCSGGDYFCSPTIYKEMVSNWDINTDLGPVLSFSSYNDYLHIFSTPDNISVTLKNQDKIRYEGRTGTGLGGDYEFVIIDLDKDAPTAMLKGKKRGTYNRLTRLPEGTDFNEYIKEMDNFKNELFPKSAKNDLVLTVDGQRYFMRGMASYMPNVFPYGSNALLNEDYHSYLITKRDGKYYMRFRSALGKGKNKEQEFCFDAESRLFRGVANSANMISPITDEYIADHFIESFTQSTISWNFDMDKSSQPIAGFLSEVQAGVKATGNTLNSVSFSPSTSGSADELSVIVTTKKGRNNTIKSVFTYAYTVEGSTITMSYKDCNGDAATLLTQVPAVQQLLDTLVDSFVITLEGDGYDVKSVRLTRAGHNEDYAILSHN